MSPDTALLVHSFAWAAIAMFAGLLFETGVFGPEINAWLMAMFMISNGVITSVQIKRSHGHD